MQEVIRSQLGYSKSKVMPLLTCCFSLIKMEFSGPSTQVKTSFNFLQCNNASASRCTYVNPPMIACVGGQCHGSVYCFFVGLSSGLYVAAAQHAGMNLHVV